MSNVNTDVAYLRSLIARASYVDFKIDDLARVEADVRKLAIAEQLTDSEIKGAGWSKIDAETFAQHFDVLSMSPREQNNWSNGFSAISRSDTDYPFRARSPNGSMRRIRTSSIHRKPGRRNRYPSPTPMAVVVLPAWYEGIAIYA